MKKKIKKKKYCQPESLTLVSKVKVYIAKKQNEWLVVGQS